MQDRKEIEKIAPKSWSIHKLQTNVPNCSRIGLILQSEHNPPETRAMRAQSFAIMLIVVGLQVQCNPIAILLQPATIQFSVPWHRPNGAKSQHKLSDPVTIMKLGLQSSHDRDRTDGNQESDSNPFQLPRVCIQVPPIAPKSNWSPSVQCSPT